MNVKPGDVAIIISGVEANIGRLVYVVDDSPPENFTSLGCSGPQKWHVTMTGSPLEDEAGEAVFGGSMTEDGLCGLNMPPEQAEDMRADGYRKLFEMVFAELEAEGEDPELIMASLVAAERDEAGKRGQTELPGFENSDSSPADKSVNGASESSFPKISQARFDHLTFDLDLDEEGVSKRYPFVKPEVWSVPMTAAERKEFMADMEAEAKTLAGGKIDTMEKAVLAALKEKNPAPRPKKA